MISVQTYYGTDSKPKKNVIFLRVQGKKYLVNITKKNFSLY